MSDFETRKRRNGFSVCYVRIPDLLIIDEFLLTPMTNEQENDLLEVIEPRAERGSIIFCTPFESDGWHERIVPSEYETLCDTVIDRIRSNAYEVLIEETVSILECHGVKAPEADDCELIYSFLKLGDVMVRDIQHLRRGVPEQRKVCTL